MLPYIGLLIITLILSIATDGKGKRNITLAEYFVCLFLILSLRSTNIGCDLAAYEPKFEALIDCNWGSVDIYVREAGYGYLNKLIGLFTDDFQYFLAVNALIVTVPLYFLYREPNKDNYLKIAIFMNMAVFPMFFSGLRQSIAIALGILAFFLILRKKLIYFCLTVLAAYYFHHSSVILLLLLPIRYINISKKALLLIIPVFIIFFVFKTQIAALVVSFLASRDDLSIYSERYGDFGDTGAYGTLFLFIIFTTLSYLFFDEKKGDERAVFLRNILVLATFFQMVALINPVLMRINYYFIVFVPIALPICLEHCKIKDGQIVTLIKLGLSVILTVYYINRAFFGIDTLQIYPYEFFWE